MRWPRVIRILIALVILGAAAVATLLAVIPFVVSTDAIRIRVAQEISAWTGYSVELKQAPRLRVFPVLRASLSGVTLSKMSAQGSTPWMSADRIDVELSPFDAIMGRLSFSETQIVRPHFTIGGPIDNFSGLLDALANSNGRLGTAIRAQKALLRNGDDDKSVATQQVSQPFGRVVIRDGTVSFLSSDEQDGNSDAQRQQVTKLSATLEWPQTTSAANLRGTALWHAETTQFNISATQALKLLAGGTSDIAAGFNATPLNLTFSGRGNISADQYFEGTLNAKSPSLMGATLWLGLPSVFGRTEIGNFSLDSAITFTTQRLKFANVELSANDNPAKGVIEIGFENEQPAVTGTLAFERLDLKQLFSVFVPLPEASRLSPNERDYAEQDVIDTNFINKAELDLRLSAQNATAGPVNLTSVAAAVQIRGGRAMFDIGDAKGFNGILQANLQIVRDLKSASAELRFNASDIDSVQLFNALGYENTFITGTGSVSLNLKSPFNRWSAVLPKANGNLAVNLGSGQMHGYSMQEFLSKAQEHRFFALDRKEKTALQFNRLELNAQISDGVATIEKAQLNTSGEILNIAGIIPFIDRSLALSGEVIFPNNQATTNTAEGVEPTPTRPPLDFFVGGSWDRPFISPASPGQ